MAHGGSAFVVFRAASRKSSGIFASSLHDNLPSQQYSKHQAVGYEKKRH
jgi:hypothetical protein